MKQLLVAVVIACLAGALLPGCAGPFKGVCGMKPIGENEHGVQFFRYYCDPE